MKVKLVEMYNINEWIDRMRETGFPGVHSDNSLVMFFVSFDGKQIIHNGCSSILDEYFLSELNRSGRRFYVLEYLDDWMN